MALAIRDILAKLYGPMQFGKNKIGKQTEKEFPCQLTVSLIDRNSRREDGTRHS
jgi:hypothetical protein